MVVGLFMHGGRPTHAWWYHRWWASGCGLITCLPRHAGSHLLVQGLLLLNAVLPSVQLLDSGLATAAPLAFNLSRGSSSSNSSNSDDPDLVLDSCTVSTSCDNLAQFAAWLHRQQQQQPYLNITKVSGVWVCGGRSPLTRG